MSSRRGVYARYATSGHLLVVTGDGKLLAMPFNPKKREVTGPSVAVMDGLLRSGPFEVNFGVSANGTLAYSSGGSAAATTAWWVNRDGATAPVDTTWKPEGNVQTVALSPDGRSLAVTLQRGAAADIWVKQLPTGPFSRVTFGDTVHLRAAWTGDGRSLTYISDLGSGAGQPMVTRADGTGAPQVVVQSKLQFAQAVPTADGKWLVLRRSFAEAGGRRPLRHEDGRHHARPAAHDRGAGDEPARLARRTVAGLRLQRVGHRTRSTSGRSPTWRRPSGRCR